MKFTQQILLMLFCVLGLAACDNGYMSWSPDGSKLAFVGKDGLRFAEPDGKLSAPVGKAEILVWLPDSKHVLVADSIALKTWAEVKQYLTDKQEAEVIDLAHYLEHQLELLGYDALDKDKRLEDTPVYMSSAAFGYLKDQDETRLKKLLGPKAASETATWSLDIHRICLRNAEANAECKELWRGFSELSDARVSPDGKFVCLVQAKANSPLFELNLMSLDSASSLSRLAVNAATGHPDWSPDSRQIFFMEAIAPNKEGKKLCALSSQEVRSGTGALNLSDKPRNLLYAVADKNSDIRCLRDGRILFSAYSVEFPATEKELNGMANIFAFKQGDQFAKKLISTADAAQEQSSIRMQVNADQTKLIIDAGETVHILDIATGNIDQLQAKPVLNPCWRNADEICFVKAVKDKSADHHDAEITLHSLSTGKDLSISENWPASAVDEILMPKKDKK